VADRAGEVIIASGRDGDIFEYGPGLVLRRTRDGRVIEREARAIAYAEAQGYPVPHVHDVLAGGTEIVMERLEGPMMMDVMIRKPWTISRYADLLADLHDRLHGIAAPDWMTRLEGEGDRLLHLDLHPMNVMLTDRGPVVIDWTNAAAGDPLTDVGLTFVLMTCAVGPMPGWVNRLLGPPRRWMTHRFVGRYRGPDLDRHIAHAAELKMFDPNMSPGEVEACRRLAARLRDGR
jgi:aminoglycoside phosphotransferase (APT) family kinase protein